MTAPDVEVAVAFAHSTHHLADSTARYATRAADAGDTLEGRNALAAAYFTADLADRYADLAGASASTVGRLLQELIASGAPLPEVRAALTGYQRARQAAASASLSSIRAYLLAAAADPRGEE